MNATPSDADLLHHATVDLEPFDLFISDSSPDAIDKAFAALFKPMSQARST